MKAILQIGDNTFALDVKVATQVVGLLADAIQVERRWRKDLGGEAYYLRDKYLAQVGMTLTSQERFTVEPPAPPSDD